MFSKKASKFNKKPKKGKKEEPAPKLSFSSKESTDEQKSVPDLICKSYADGCLVLGCIHEIIHDQLIVTLPGISNFGYVNLNQISNEYTKYLQDLNDKRNFIQLNSMYTIGSFLRCKVLNYSNKRLYLTIQPNEVNSNLKLKDLEAEMIISGSVKSKEDHGYSVNLGINDAVGFIKNEDLTEDEALSIGKTLNFKIKSVNKRVINLIPIRTKQFDRIKYKANFNTYLPGSKLTCNVEKIYKNGLKVTINGVASLVGYLHLNHLNVKLTSLKSLKSKFKHADKLDATILYINPYSKVLYLTQLEHLFNDDSSSRLEEMIFLNKLAVGSSIKNAKIIRHSFKGIYVQFNFEKYKSLVGFISKRDLIDKDELEKIINNEKSEKNDEDEEGNDENDTEKEKETLTQYYWKHITKEFVERHFPVNKNLTSSRVIDYNFVDNLVMLTTCASKLSEDTYLSYHDPKLKIGEIVRGKVVSFARESGGLVIKLSDHVKGFIPKIHTADIPLNDPLAKMPLDKEIKCKIIQSSPNDKKLILTAKKTLIKLKPEQEICSISDDLKIDFETYGVIVAIKQYGLLIGFYNEVKALIPLAEIPNIERKLNEPVDLTRYFHVGQLVKCRLAEVNLEKQQLKMSLKFGNEANKPRKMEVDEVAKPKEAKFVKTKYYVGDLIQPSLTTQLTVHLKNASKGYIFIKLLSANKFEYAVLYKYHLTDNEHLNECLFSLLKNNSNINDIFSVHENTAFLVLHDKSNLDGKSFNKYFLTYKKSLLNVYLNEIGDSEERDENDYYTGWICKKQDKGLLVEIVTKSRSNDSDIKTGTLAYCSNKNIKKQNINLDEVKLGQTVLCRINKSEKRNNLYLINEIRCAKALSSTTKYAKDLEFGLNYLNSTFNATYLLLKSRLLNSYKPIESQEPNDLRLNWFKNLKESKNLAILNRISVTVKSIDAQTNKVNCVYEEEGINYKFNAYGYLNINEDLNEESLIDAKTNGVIIGYDENQMSLCLALEQPQQEFLKKHKHSLSLHNNLEILKDNQIVKGEVIGFTSDYCVISLKQHAMGRIAYMPLFRFDKTQSKNMEKLNQLALLEKKINNTRIKKDCTNYYSVGQVGKFMLKFINNDYVLCKLEGKLKQKAAKNDEMTEVEEVEKKKAVKRKSNDGGDVDSIEIVKENKKKKKQLTGFTNGKAEDESTGLGDSIEYPWEITNFDQFYELIREKEPEHVVAIDEAASANDASQQSRKKQKKNFETIDKEIAKQEEKLFERQLDSNNAETPDDYERLLIANPNSSLIWIKYIVFYLQSAEIDKSRQIAERALKTILYKDEVERVNVWVAYLNLENMYGSQEKLDEVFHRATQNCDTLKIYQHLAEIYARSNKIEEAQTLFNKMIRKFNRVPEVWIKYAIFEYKNKNCEVARKLLLKCLNVLDKKDHIDIVNKFAQLEFKYGDVERAKTMYDSLLFTYPNRTDLWSVYIDMLVKYDRKNEARNVFNRIIQLNLNAKRMKFIFKKYLDFEKQHGDESLVENVKQMAMKYVENKEEVFKMALQHQQNGNDIEMKDENDYSDDLEKNIIKKLKV